jgi:WD40 repeat protein
LWSLPGGEPLGEFRHAVQINCLSLNPEGKLAVGCYFQCFLWDITSRKLDFDKSIGHIDSVCISNDSRLIAYAGSHRTTVYEGPLGDQVAEFYADRGHTFRSQGLAMSPDGKFLASCMDLDSCVGLWELPEGNFRSLPLPRYAQSLAVSPDGRMLVAGTVNSVCLWSLPPGDVARTLEVETPSPGHSRLDFYVEAVDFSADSRTLATLAWRVDRQSRVQIWRLPEGNLLHTIDHAGLASHCLKIAPNGRIVASGDKDGVVRIWGP